MQAMTAKVLTFILSFSLFAGVSASAATFTEAFDPVSPEDFFKWKTEGWLGTNSNLRNYLASISEAGENARDNNPDGLWIDDGDGLFSNDPLSSLFENRVQIDFKPSFAASLRFLALDIVTYVNGVTFEIFDLTGNALFSTTLTPPFVFELPINPKEYVRYSATSASGIGGFRFLGVLVEGTTSIDNVSASTETAAKVSDTTATSLLVGLGLVTIAAFRRRYSR